MTVSFFSIHGKATEPSDSFVRKAHVIPLENLEKARESCLSIRYSDIKNHKFFCVLTMATCSGIRSISFVPTENTTQNLYISRESIPTSPIENYVSSVENTHFPVSLLCDHRSILASTEGIDATLIEDIRSILQAFLLDYKTKAVALNFNDGTGSFTTRVWSKS